MDNLKPAVLAHHVGEGEAVGRADQDDGNAGIGFGARRVPIMLRVPRDCRLSA